MSLQPLAFYAVRVPAGDMLIPAIPAQQAGTVSVTMASIDPTEVVSAEDTDKPQRSTLKIIRLPFDLSDEEDEDDDDYEDMDEDEDEDEDDSDAEVNGGPSDLGKLTKSKKQALLEAMEEDDSDEEIGDDDDEESEDDDDPVEQAKAIKALEAAIRPDKGKGKAVDGEDEDSEDIEDDEDLSDDEGLMEEEIVVCTLDTNQHYQQPLNITVAKHEMVFFQVTGTHTIHLTGNYVAPVDPLAGMDMDDEDDEYDLSPDEEEMDGLDELIAPGSESESDELDDIADPTKANRLSQKKRKIEEVDDEDDEEVAAKKPTIAKAVEPAQEEAAKPLLPASPVAEPAVNGEAKKLTKTEKKRLKKQAKNAETAPATSDTAVDASPKKETQVNGTANGAEKKSVQFAKSLEQGPSSSATSTKSDTSKPTKVTKELNIQGMKIEIRESGEGGPAAKKNSKIEMRYIGKLTDGKVFDSNKSGIPFKFKLGVGEVIKGWDLGLEGIQKGATRRLIIPSKLAYGKKALPGIPANSDLTFDVKCLSVS